MNAFPSLADCASGSQAAGGNLPEDHELLHLMGLETDELERRARVPFRLTATTPALLDDFADSLVDLIKERNSQGEPTRLILPIGPVKQYEKVIARSNREKISWRNVFCFGMDEFLDWQGRRIPEAHPLSFRGFMWNRVFEQLAPDLRVRRENCVFPDPGRIDEYSERIRSVGGIDCCYGGIGYHGHIAFNEPPLSRWNRVSLNELRNSLTRVVVLGADSVVNQSIQCAGGCAPAIPPMGVTVGMRDILEARRIRLYCAAGERHRAIFRITVAGPQCIEYPSTLVQGHPDAEVVTDLATAQPITASLG